MEKTEREQKIERYWQQACELQQRFGEIFGETNTERAQKLAREIELDGDLATIPVAHRLAVARQLIIALHQHGLIEYDVDDDMEHWRVVGARLGLPFLEVIHAVFAYRYRGDTTRSDLDEWLAWAREHAPERLMQSVNTRTKAAARRKARA
jgi:hypothetical protein